MRKTLIFCALSFAGTAVATPFTGNDAASSAMGNTGVASATPQNAFQFNPGLLADYDADTDFGLTLPAVKFFVDDSRGFIDSASDFTAEGGTWDQYQTVDANALQDAVANLDPTLTAIGNNVTSIQNAIDQLEDGDDTNDEAALNSLSDASVNLNSNATSLDNDTTTVNVQMTNINSTTTAAQSDLEGFSGKPVQLGLGIDLLNVAIPSESLAMGLSVSTSTTIGTSFDVSGNDLNPIVALSADLAEFSLEATELTGAVNNLAQANSEFAQYLEDRPTEPGAEYDAWEAGLQAKKDAIDSAKLEVETQQSELQTFTGSNNKVTNGEITIGTVDDPQSEIEIVGANISEIGVSVARKFVIQGEEVAIGVTPKFQSINVFEKTISFNNYENEASTAGSDPAGYFLNNTTTLYRANLDIGAAKSWNYYGRVRAGIAIKDLIPWTLESKQGTELIIRPKVRIGAAHETRFTKIALDIDVTENKPLKYGVPTRYLGIGAEVNAWGQASLRAGYRNNLSVEGSHVISGGIGLTPFGTGLEISAWAKPGSFDDWTRVVQDAGMVAQFSVNF